MKQCTIESTIKPLSEKEYIGYISFSNPFQNIFCEISESKEYLQDVIKEKVGKLRTEFLQPLYEKVDHIQKI